MAHWTKKNTIKEDLLTVHDATYQALLNYLDEDTTDEQFASAVKIVDGIVTDYFKAVRLTNAVYGRRFERAR